MTRAARAWRWPVWCTLTAAGLLLASCGQPPKKPPAERVALTIHLPCVISGPMRKVITGYETAHPEVEIWDEKQKPLALVGAASQKQSRPAVVITMGEREMGALVQAGVVTAGQVREVAVSAYPLAVIVPAKGAGHIQKLDDLANPSVKRIFVEDPTESSLGDRAKQAFEKLGLWEKIAPKIVQFDPDENVLSQLLAGKAEAAVVFKDCLLEGGQPPKTVRLVGELPSRYYPPVTYQAAVIAAAPNSKVAQEFVDYLVSPGGREALQRAGLTPPPTR